MRAPLIHALCVPGIERDWKRINLVRSPYAHEEFVRDVLQKNWESPSRGFTEDDGVRRLRKR